MGVRLKGQIDYVYGRLQALFNTLGNIAFWDGKPAASTLLPDLDWGNPKHTVTLALTLTHAVVKHNGVAVSNGATIQVEEFTDLTLTVEAESGYTLGTVSSQAGTVTGNTVKLTMGTSNVTLDITATATSSKSISIVSSDGRGDLSISPNTVTDGGNFSGVISFDEYFDGVEIVSVKDSGNNNVTYSFDDSTNTLSISSVTSDITITAKAKKTLKLYIDKSLTSHGAVATDTGSSKNRCYSDYIRLDGLDKSKVLKWYHNFGGSSNPTYWNIMFYDKNKKKIFRGNTNDSKWVPVSQTPGLGGTYRDIATTILAEALGADDANAPVYVRASFKCDNGVLMSGCRLTQNDGAANEVAFFDPTDVEFATAPTERKITYASTTIPSARCTCSKIPSLNENVQANVIDGENFEAMVQALDGYDPTTIAITVEEKVGDTLTDITNDSTKVQIIDYIDTYSSNAQSKIIKIASVTTDLIITTTATAL